LNQKLKENIQNMDHRILYDTHLNTKALLVAAIQLYRHCCINSVRPVTGKCNQPLWLNKPYLWSKFAISCTPAKLHYALWTKQDFILPFACYKAGDQNGTKWITQNVAEVVAELEKRVQAACSIKLNITLLQSRFITSTA
jgi:hypothetical protein